MRDRDLIPELALTVLVKPFAARIGTNRVPGHFPLIFGLGVPVPAPIHQDFTMSGIGTIGEMVGWADPYYFSRIFRTKIGASPRAWRAQHAVDAPITQSDPAR